jgi:hypothetical protein
MHPDVAKRADLAQSLVEVCGDRSALRCPESHAPEPFLVAFSAAGLQRNLLHVVEIKPLQSHGHRRLNRRLTSPVALRCGYSFAISAPASSARL